MEGQQEEGGEDREGLVRHVGAVRRHVRDGLFGGRAIWVLTLMGGGVPVPHNPYYSRTPPLRWHLPVDTRVDGL